MAPVFTIRTGDVVCYRDPIDPNAIRRAACVGHGWHQGRRVVHLGDGHWCYRDQVCALQRTATRRPRGRRRSPPRRGRNDRTAHNTPAALRSLRLCRVEGEHEGVSLVSLAHRCVLAEAQDLTSFADVPDLDLSEGLEQRIKAEAGLTHAGWPGWEAVFDYLDRHPEVLGGAARPAVAGALRRLQGPFPESP